MKKEQRERNAANNFKSGKKQDAQPGHEGRGRKLISTADVDKIVPCYAVSTCGCGTTLLQGDVSQRKEVSYFKDKRLIITEFQIYKIKCPNCKQSHRGQLPAGTPRGAFGACVHAVICTLTGRYKMPKRNVASCLSDLFGLTIAIDSVSNVEHTVSQSLYIPTEEVHAAVKAEPITHNDETSYYRQHKRTWLWAMGTQMLAFFKIADYRNQTVAIDLLGETTYQIRVTDRYAAYNIIPKANHQYCWSHLKRDIKQVSGRSNPQECVVGIKLESARHDIFRYRRKYNQSDDAKYQTFYKNRILGAIKRFRYALRDGIKLTETQPAGFCKNLIRDWRCLWHFIRKPEVPPTNNHGERIIRPCVSWRKISHGTQSVRGDRYVERITTADMSCRLQKRHLPLFLQNAVQAWWKGGNSLSLLIK